MCAIGFLVTCTVIDWPLRSTLSMRGRWPPSTSAGSYTTSPRYSTPFFGRTDVDERGLHAGQHVLHAARDRCCRRSRACRRWASTRSARPACGPRAPRCARCRRGAGAPPSGSGPPAGPCGANRCAAASVSLSSDSSSAVPSTSTPPSCAPASTYRSAPSRGFSRAHRDGRLPYRCRFRPCPARARRAVGAASWPAHRRCRPTRPRPPAAGFPVGCRPRGASAPAVGREIPASSRACSPTSSPVRPRSASAAVQSSRSGHRLGFPRRRRVRVGAATRTRARVGGAARIPAGVGRRGPRLLAAASATRSAPPPLLGRAVGVGAGRRSV